MGFVSVVACHGSPGQSRQVQRGNLSVGALVCAAAAAGLVSVTAFPASVDAYGLNSAGRVQKCRGDEACVSTSSVGNPSKFGAPWTYEPQTGDAVEAWKALKVAVEGTKESGVIVESRDGPREYYLRAEFPSFLKGVDDVEFKLLPEENLVTYRSASREAIFVYPIQTPINSGKNTTRLKEIRGLLGWSELDGDIMSYATTEASPAPDFLPDFE